MLGVLLARRGGRRPRPMGQKKETIIIQCERVPFRDGLHTLDREGGVKIASRGKGPRVIVGLSCGTSTIHGFLASLPCPPFLGGADSSPSTSSELSSRSSKSRSFAAAASSHLLAPPSCSLLSYRCWKKSSPHQLLSSG